jgi:transposase InsO family protein
VAGDQKAETVARTLVEHLITCHGVLEQLLSDRGSNFLSELVQEICKLLGIERKKTLADITLKQMGWWRNSTALSSCCLSVSRNMVETGINNCLMSCSHIA